jgi:V-type H+-transporting ATPase subunit G
MATNQPSQEVQLLLAAEKRASEKVSDARKRKAQLLKKAKEEAAADIEQFKAERQIVFNKYETEHIGSKDDIAKQIDRDTTERLRTLQERMKTNQQKIIDALMANIVDGVMSWTYPKDRPKEVAF